MASINDVAKLVKVSKSTISLVINNNGYVSDENREKVQKTIKETNNVASYYVKSGQHQIILGIGFLNKVYAEFSSLTDTAYTFIPVLVCSSAMKKMRDSPVI